MQSIYSGTPRPISDFNIENYIKSKEYQINKDNIYYNILIGKTSKHVIIRSLQFCINITPEEFGFLNINDKSIDNLFDYFVDIFDKKKIKIDEIKPKKIMKLILIGINKKKEEKKFELILNYYPDNTEHIINHLWNEYIKIQNNLNKIQEENNQIKENCKKLKENNQKLKEENNTIKEDNKKLNKEIELTKQELNKIKKENEQIKENIKKDKNNYSKLTEEINSIKNDIQSNNINFQNQIPYINNNNDINIINEENEVNNGFSLLFREPGGSIKATLDNCRPNDTVKDLMEKYKKKTKNNSEFYFIYNAKQLNEDETLEQAGLMNLVTINVMKGRPPLRY